MEKPVSLPRIEGPLHEWCAICGNRSLPSEQAYCGQCEVAWQAYQAGLAERLGHRLLGRLTALPSQEPGARPAGAAPRKP